MRKKLSIVLGGIFVLWGTAVVINGLTTTNAGGSYGAGQSAAVVLGVVMAVVGGRALYQGLKVST
jgi:hypothetical protein